MRYLFDRDSNTLAVTFAEGRQYRDSEEITDGLVIDFDAEGRPYAIEFLRADRFVDIDGLVSGKPVRLTPEAIGELPELTATSLRQWREHLALTPEDLAARLRVPPETITGWESGARAIENASVLALALKAIEGNAHEQHLRQALRDVTEALQTYLKNESAPLKLASGGRSK